MRQLVRSALVLGLSLWPALAWACPVCFSAKNEANRIAFLGTTVFLTALPLVLAGSVIYWLAERSAAQAAEDEAQLAPSEDLAAVDAAVPHSG